MKTHYWAICSTFLVLAAMGAVAQDTTCEDFEIERIACNDSNNNWSTTYLDNVIIGDNGSGCKHPVMGSLICTSGSKGNPSCPNSYPEVAVDNPYCAQFCGCGGDCGGDGGGGGGGDCECGYNDEGKCTPCDNVTRGDLSKPAARRLLYGGKPFTCFHPHQTTDLLSIE